MSSQLRPRRSGVRAGQWSVQKHAAAALAATLLLPHSLPAARPDSATVRPDTPVVVVPSTSSGPTLLLKHAAGECVGNPITDLMYFVALISPDPVSVSESPGNTQRARMVSAARRSNANTFTVSCVFELTGQGRQRNVFDHSARIRQQEDKMRHGGVLDRLLESISVEGSGTLNVEVEGASVSGVPKVNTVRFQFDGRGHESPVSIDLQDLHYVGGTLRSFNGMVARVTSLTFRRQPGVARMDISVASIRRKDAGDGTWESLKSKVKATAANLIMDPVDVDPAGHEAMFGFGLALASDAPAFTFPRARNLKQ
jgi:hypothetical protein